MSGYVLLLILRCLGVRCRFSAHCTLTHIHSQVVGCIFRGADLRHVRWARPRVSGADLTGASLRGLSCGGEEAPLTGHTDWVWAVAVDPKGKFAVSASDDTTLKVTFFFLMSRNSKKRIAGKVDCWRLRCSTLQAIIANGTDAALVLWFCTRKLVPR